MSVGQVAREVVGAKDRHHAVRFVRSSALPSGSVDS